MKVNLLLFSTAAMMAYSPRMATAGSVDGELATDLLRGESTSNLPVEGLPNTLTASEMGLRFRMSVNELDERLHLNVDYRAREPLPGNLRNSAVRLVYQGELSYDVIPDQLTIGIGRFLTASSVLLPVDGVRARYKPETSWTLVAFAGRRGVSLSRRNIDFQTFLPAAGGSVTYTQSTWLVEVAAAYAEEQAILAKASQTEEISGRYGAFNGYLRTSVQAADNLSIGGHLGFVQQAAYVLGPDWPVLDIDTEVLGLWNASAFANWRIFKSLQLGYDFQYQRAAVYRQATRHQAGNATTDQIDTNAPAFMDNRGRVTYLLKGIGRAYGEFRVRVRPDWLELRFAASLDIHQLGVKGLYLSGRVTHDEIVPIDETSEAQLADRTAWSLGLGFRRWGLDTQTGVRILDRDLILSGRSAAPLAPGSQPNLDDLSPFVLEAQSFWYLRTFYSGRKWFAGFDLERNIMDNEYRVLAQLGAYMEVSW